MLDRPDPVTIGAINSAIHNLKGRDDMQAYDLRDRLYARLLELVGASEPERMADLGDGVHAKPSAVIAIESLRWVERVGPGYLCRDDHRTKITFQGGGTVYLAIDVAEVNRRLEEARKPRS